MMTRIVTMLTAAFLAVTPAFAQTQCDAAQTQMSVDTALAQVADAVDTHPYPRGIHWKISKNDVSSIMYGTVHMGDSRISIPSSLRTAIEQADALFLEVDETQMGNVSSIMSRLDIFFQIDGPDLRPMFSDAEWATILDKFSQFNVPEIFANRMKPWAITAMLFVDTCTLEELSGAAPGVDDQLMRIAKVNGVPVKGLEKIDDLLALLDDRDFDADMKVLKHLLAMDVGSPGQYPGFMGGTALTLDLYLQEETVALWELTQLQARTLVTDPIMDRILDGVYEKLLIERNHNWLDTLVPMLEKGDIVVGVGALHLPGEHGLLHLLSERGFTVERITG